MYHFLVNHHGASGKTVAKWNKIKKILDEKNIEYTEIVPQYAGHATKIAEELCNSSTEPVKLVIIGGDGTINEVINGITDFEKISLGVIPVGSGNDFARGMNIPRSSYKKALDLILNAPQDHKIDLGKSTCDGNSRLFAISSGFGMDALVGTKINGSKIKKFCNMLHIGSLSYSLMTIKVLFGMETMKARITFDDGSVLNFDQLVFIASMNCFAEGGGVPMAPDAKPDDGYLSLCIGAGIPKWRTFLKFPVLALGWHKNSSGFTLKNCKWFEVETDIPTVMNTDGEYVGTATKARVEILPSKLRVLC